MRYLLAPLDREASDALADRIDARLERQGFGLWALERRDTGEFIGFTGLNPMPEGTPGAGGQEIGWRLAAGSWHQGYATEAAKAVVDVAFNGLNLPEIWSINLGPERAVAGGLAPARHDRALLLRPSRGADHQSLARARRLLAAEPCGC